MGKKYGVLFVVILCIGLLVTGGTYAYWTWTSSPNKNVVFNVSPGVENYIVYDEGDSYFIGDFKPSANYCDGLKNTISFNKTTNDVNLTATINMDINAIETNFRYSDSFYWVITSGDSTNCTGNLDDALNYGRFKGKNKGDVIELLEDIDVTTTSQKFTVWLWLDSFGELITGLSGQTLDTNIWTQFDMLDATDIDGVDNRYRETLLNGADPVLDEGMVPVILSADGTVTVANINNEWYNYGDKEWANVVLVKEEATSSTTGSHSREYYLNNPGTTVLESDILAYYVWIPRYKYRIPESNVLCSSLTEPTFDKNYECYYYDISDSDKELLINYWYDYNYEMYMDDYNYVYTKEEARKEVEDAIEGIYSISNSDKWSVSFEDMIAEYDGENDTDLNYSLQFDGTRRVNVPRTIDVIFENNKKNVSLGDAINTYYTHPAFIWGDKKINGIWVGKFETTGNIATPTIKPNVKPLGNSFIDINHISDYFNNSLKFAGGVMNTSTGVVTFEGSNTYGLTKNTDSHMMKNSDWGAITYLSYSIYGLNDEVRINNYYSSGTMTGCGADTSNANSLSVCGIKYGDSLDYPQSTTGNITGLFDMSGGVSEYVMGVLGNSELIYDESEGHYVFSLEAYPSAENGFDVMPEIKYYDLYSDYQFGDYTIALINRGMLGELSTNLHLCTLEACGGHALGETLGWYRDSVDVIEENMFFLRGSNYMWDFTTGLFAFDNANGITDLDIGKINGFRISLVIE